MPAVIYSENGGFEIMLDNGVLVWVRPEVEDETAHVVFEVPEGVGVSMGCRTPIPDSDRSEVRLFIRAARASDGKRIM